MARDGRRKPPMARMNPKKKRERRVRERRVRQVRPVRPVRPVRRVRQSVRTHCSIVGGPFVSLTCTTTISNEVNVAVGAGIMDPCEDEESSASCVPKRYFVGHPFAKGKPKHGDDEDDEGYDSTEEYPVSVSKSAKKGNLKRGDSDDEGYDSTGGYSVMARKSAKKAPGGTRFPRGGFSFHHGANPSKQTDPKGNLKGGDDGGSDNAGSDSPGGYPDSASKSVKKTYHPGAHLSQQTDEQQTDESSDISDEDPVSASKSVKKTPVNHYHPGANLSRQTGKAKCGDDKGWDSAEERRHMVCRRDERCPGGRGHFRDVQRFGYRSRLTVARHAARDAARDAVTVPDVTASLILPEETVPDFAVSVPLPEETVPEEEDGFYFSSDDE
jgi:hypothetical protein